MRKQLGIGLKIQFSQFFGQCLRYEEQIGHQKSVKVDDLVCEGQIEEIPSVDPEKLEHFLPLAYFPTRSSQEFGTPTPLKTSFLNRL